ncbi:MAG: glycosyltransferase family 39 protein, partial [Candidatus Parcubacteria bacterium]|nr:glycosyltransferase family 39 protein [Candidatus Parcubacteria bacterium]
MNKSLFWLIIPILLIGFFLRFYKLDWGEGLYTHPDEYHIATSVSQLVFPTQMHPHFFSYGTVTIYLIYFTQQIISFISSTLNPFILGRFYSALFSTLTILIVYKICRSFMERRFSYFAALLVTLTPGLIQQAHFATPESALTFFLFGSLLFIIKFLKHNKFLYLALASIFLGFALGVKISSAVFLLPILAGTIIKFFRKPFRLILFTITSLAIAIVTFAVAAPFVFLDFSAFRGNLEYEGALAVGKIPVFYTRQFIDTVPVLFQIEKILPYALGPALLFLGILGLLLLVVAIMKKPKAELLLILIAFFSIFIPNSFLFAKWTRFIAPAFPFFGIFSAFLLDRIEKKNRSLALLIFVILATTTLIWTAAFFSIYAKTDVRITTSSWIENNLPQNATILVEGGNMIDVPLKGDFQRISLDFYNLENNPKDIQKTISSLSEADYFIIQSRRVFLNHQRLPDQFPKTAHFYDALFNGRLGFEQIKQFDSFPQVSLF